MAENLAETSISGRIGEDGYWYPSVTEILRITESPQEQDRLRKWRHKQAKLQRETGIPLTESESQARDRGTKVHKVIEQFLAGEPVDPSSNEWQYLWKALPVLTQLKEGGFRTELLVFNYQDKYCGRLDCLRITPEEGTGNIIDFKSSKRPWLRSWTKKAFLQGVAYATAYMTRAKLRIEEIEVHVLSPHLHQCWYKPLDSGIEDWHLRLSKFKKTIHKLAEPPTISIRDGGQIDINKAYPGFYQ
jgi:hypothetical protein